MDLGRYPIVDGKYLDLNRGQLMFFIGLLWKAGPPYIEVCWQNRYYIPPGDQFHSASNTIFSTRRLGEYIIRIGNFLRERPWVCELEALNATPYSVYVVVKAQGSQRDLIRALKDYGLAD